MEKSTKKQLVNYHRQPNKFEMKFGEGAIHYIDLPESLCKKKDGSYKKWLVNNGERYYY